MKKYRRILAFFYFSALILPRLCQQEQQQQRSTKILDVGIMCSVDGITAMVKFDDPGFNGKIYSSKYIAVHQCVYYNTRGDEQTILFTIPNYNCGTVVEKDGQNLVSHIENEVYVQFEKDVQNEQDRRYLFVCDREKRPAPLPPRSPLDSGGGGNPRIPAAVSGGGIDISSNNNNIGSRRETLHPVQTIIVETISPTRLTATNGGGGNGGGLIIDDVENSVNGEFHVNNQQKPLVWMEIRDGNSPGRPELPKQPLKLGDPLILIVSGRSKRTDLTSYDVFAHSCFASDGSPSNRVELTDSSGCTVRPSVAQRTTRRKDVTAGVISYSLPFKAFKFPTSNDVYFSCSVDICSSCDFSDICTENSTTIPFPPNPNRSPRNVKYNNYKNYYNRTNPVNSVEPVIDNVIPVYDAIKIFDNDDIINDRKMHYHQQQQQHQKNITAACFSDYSLTILISSFAFLTLALACTMLWAAHLHRKLQKHK